MTTSDFALKGDIVYSATQTELSCTEDGYLVCEDGRCAGVFATLPERYQGIALRDLSGHLIIPGITDLHTHAPQFSFRGSGMDLELLDWLQAYTFPEEARYHSLDYAQDAYQELVQALVQGATTRAVLFGTLHVPATKLLMDALENSGLVTMVGKVNMDRNAIPALQETSAAASLEATRQWLEEVAASNYQRTSAILTPRFIPSCSDQLMRGLGQLQQQTQLPVQSHLSENLSEIAWVRELCPDADGYADAYRRFDLLGGADCPTIMAHCVYSDEQETEMLKQQGVWLAHCAESNTALASGIAPVRRFLDEGLRLGLGSDVAGGHTQSMLHSIAETVKVSKLRWRLFDDSPKPLTFAEAFYLATCGGGSFFGRVGSFAAGYQFDAVVLADRQIFPRPGFTLAERLERAVYADDPRVICAKYVEGQMLF